MPVARRVLILGGTADALELAEGLEAQGIPTITSLAGVTAAPRLPASAMRRGGFGGASGLAAYIRQEAVAAMADATHPFALQMSLNASVAAIDTGTPLFRLERPAWSPEPGDDWWHCASAADAARRLPVGARPLVTIGRKEIGGFLARTDLAGVARMIEPSGLPVPPGWTVILDRPPYTVEGETALITHHAITHLVTKNSGGGQTAAKLGVARTGRLPVLMIDRPAKPEAPCFPTVKEIIPAIRRVVLP